MYTTIIVQNMNSLCVYIDMFISGSCSSLLAQWLMQEKACDFITMTHLKITLCTNVLSSGIRNTKERYLYIYIYWLVKKCTDPI